LPDLLLSSPGALADQSRVAKALGQMSMAANDAREIVRRLREFYRPEDQLEMHPVMVKDLIEQVVTLTEPAWKTQAQAAGKEIRVAIDLQAAPCIEANESALREMLTNLVLNAVDAIPKAGLITLQIAQSEAGVIIQVSDTAVPQAGKEERRESAVGGGLADEARAGEDGFSFASVLGGV